MRALTEGSPILRHKDSAARAAYASEKSRPAQGSHRVARPRVACLASPRSEPFLFPTESDLHGWAPSGRCPDSGNAIGIQPRVQSLRPEDCLRRVAKVPKEVAIQRSTG